MRRLLVFLLISLLLASPTWAATVTKLQSSTQDTWHTGGAGLTSGSTVLSSAVTVTSAGYLGANCLLNVASFSTNVTAGTAVVAWFIVSPDGGTTYPDTASTPQWTPDMIFPLQGGISTQQIIPFEIPLGKLPVGSFKVLIKNDATGATMNTAWTLKCKPFTLQSN
jgi:hypothetical protein